MIVDGHSHACGRFLTPDSILNSLDSNGVDKAEKNDLPLFIHLYSDSEVVKIIEYKKKHLDLNLIIAHLFGLELFIKQNFKDENLYFDTSTLQLISKTAYWMQSILLEQKKFYSGPILHMDVKTTSRKT